MSFEDVAKRLSREHFELDIQMKHLLACVDFMPRTNESSWIDECRATYSAFREHLLRHMDLEEAGGYLANVMERRPGLASEVERLQREHHSLRYLIDSLADAVNAMTAAEPLRIRDCCHRVRDLISYIRHHEHDENMTVLSAFTDDIGTKD
ncbi:MAG: hemerythrin domain-containing protein [Phycisphaerales bacterium]|nr:hemerythrin domain-containing protein [Phycisphaerales bacterium]